MIAIAFKNNAMFLQSMRQRMRPATVLAFAVLSFIIIALIFSEVSVRTQRYIYPNLEIFKNILNAHLFLLLGLGTWNAFQAAMRERVVGTIEFHRASPTPAFWQMIGLLFGSTCLEWIIFIVTLPVNLVLSLKSSLGISFVLQVYVSVILCALLFHMMGLFFGFLRAGRWQNKKFNFSGIFFFIALYVFSHSFLMFDRYSEGVEARKFSSHLACFSLVGEVYQKAQSNIIYYENKKYSTNNRYYQNKINRQPPKSMFYNLEINTLLLQVLLQLPLFYLLGCGIKRFIKLPHAPPFSKEQQLVGLMYIFFIFLADVYIDFVYPKFFPYAGVAQRYYDTVFILSFGFLVLSSGIIGTFMSTPSRLSYLIGLKKSAKSGKKLSALDEHNTNFFWLMLFIMISLSYFLILQPLLTNIDKNFYSIILIIMLIQITALAGSWEAFALSRFGSSPILFIVGVSILWIFLPIFGSIFNGEWSRAYYHQPSLWHIFSPFYLESLRSYGEYIWSAFSLNMILAVSAWLVAFKQRARIQTGKN